MKRVVDMCPFMGLAYEDEDGERHIKGEGLSKDENEKLDAYFERYLGEAFSRDKSIELAQLALDDQPIPEGWKPK